MYNQNFFIPRYYPTTIPRFVRNIPPTGINSILRNQMIKNPGIFDRIGGMFNSIKRLNWGNLITNTSKTLGVINQTIPIVKQVRPMIGNMRSMLKLASVFKDETDINPKKTQYNTTTNTINNEKKRESYLNNYYESPTFFI